VRGLLSPFKVRACPSMLSVRTHYHCTVVLILRSPPCFVSLPATASYNKMLAYEATM